MFETREREWNVIKGIHFKPSKAEGHIKYKR